jgi:beta-glucosidase
LVTGPLADNTDVYVSRYGPQNLDIINVLTGIRNYVGRQAKIDYALGCEVVDEGFPGSELIPLPLNKNEKALINDAVRKAKKSDVIIVVAGVDELRCCESKSRTNLGFPGRQLQLIQALYQTGKPIVLIMINGQPMTINWENHYLPAILEAWFPNAMGGQAIAETLYGDYNPGGKLPVTFPKSLGQIQLNFPFKPGSHAGQPDSGPNGWGNTSVVGALYPFGYGLSYTTFEYSKLKISPTKQKTQGEIKISVDVTNTGKHKGDEVVQLYLKDVISSVTTYETQLRGFERITLNPHETKTVHFTLQPTDMELLEKNMQWVVEPGMFEVHIGSSSEDIRLKGEFELQY